LLLREERRSNILSRQGRKGYYKVRGRTWDGGGKRSPRFSRLQSRNEKDSSNESAQRGHDALENTIRS